MQINRFCASGLDAVNFAAAQVMSGQHDMAVGGGVESMSRVGIGASGGAWPVDPSIALKSYFMPQGISADLIATKYGFSRAQCDEYAVESQKRTAVAWQEGCFGALGDPGEGPERPHHPGARRASAARHQHAVARAAQAVVRADGRARRLRRGRGAGASRDRVRRACASCRQFLRHRRRRRRRADRQPRRRPRREAQAARQDQGVRQYRLRSGADADRADRRHRKGAQARQDEAQGHRPDRGQRGVRRGGAALPAGVQARSRTRSTSTAARSPWAIRWARPAP